MAPREKQQVPEGARVASSRTGHVSFNYGCGTIISIYNRAGNSSRCYNEHFPVTH